MNTMFYGVHIPKTAGASFLDLFKKSFSSAEFFQNTALIDIASDEALLLEEIVDYSKLRLVFGHHVTQNTLALIGREPYVFTFLRDPIKRFMSNYLFDDRLRASQGRKKISFPEFVESSPDNFLCNWLIDRFPALVCSQSGRLNEMAWDVISHFDFVSSPEFFSEDVPQLFERIGIPDAHLGRENTSSAAEYQEIDTPENRLLLNIKLEEDVRLYDRFLNVRQHRSWEPERCIDVESLSAGSDVRDMSLQETLKFCCIEYENFGVRSREVERAINRAAVNICKAKSFLGMNVPSVQEVVNNIKKNSLSV